ncbi:MAG: hypothetical protein ACK559_10870, partial [bacterium]
MSGPELVGQPTSNSNPLLQFSVGADLLVPQFPWGRHFQRRSHAYQAHFQVHEVLLAVHQTPVLRGHLWMHHFHQHLS